MAYSVAMKSEPDNADDIPGDIQTWLNDLSITTLHSLTIIHYQGFYRCICVYE